MSVSALEKLIKSEVAKRFPDVKIIVDEWLNLWLHVGERTLVVKYSYGRVFVNSGEDEFNPGTVEDYRALSRAFEALADIQRQMDRNKTSLLGLSLRQRVLEGMANGTVGPDSELYKMYREVQAGDNDA